MDGKAQWLSLLIMSWRTCLQVVVVELCRDRVGLMLNPDGPMGVQLWNSRQLSISGLPKADSWPTEREVLSGRRLSQSRHLSKRSEHLVS